MKDYACKLLVVLILLFAGAASTAITPAEAETKQDLLLQETLFLTADAGELNAEAGQTLRAQAALLGKTPRTVIFAGDNIYPLGLPDPADSSYATARERLDRQLRLVSEIGAKTLFVPGNHDWANKGLSEKARVVRAAEAINRELRPGSALPPDGCAGPIESAVSENFRVIAADSQWLSLIYPDGKDLPASCPSADRFYEELSRLLSRDGSRPLIYMQHHPIFGATTQGPNYPKDRLLKVLGENRPLICLAGHEHSLQVIEGKRGCRFYLVSGAMTNLSNHSDREISPEDGTLLFSRRYLGFMRLDLFRDGRIRLQVIKTGKNEGPLGKVTFEKFLR